MNSRIFDSLTARFRAIVHFLAVAIPVMRVFREGNRALDARRYDEATTAYTEAIRLEPLASGAYYNRGAAYYRLGQYDKAIADYTKTIELYPSFNAYFNRGLAHERAERFDRAIADMTRALELAGKKERAVTYYNRGAIYRKQGKPEAAIADYDAALRLTPNDAAILVMRANAHADLGQFEQAIGDYTKAAELDPKEESAFTNRAEVYADLGMLDKADADYARALEIDPTSAWTHNSMGMYLHQRGQYEAAREHYLTALQAGPEPETLLGLFACSLRLGDLDAADKYAAEARALIPQDDWYDRACLEALSGHINFALDCLRLAVQKVGHNRVVAWEDLDLESIRGDPRFREIVGPPPGQS